MKEYLKRIDEVIKNGKYQDTWESLQQYEVPLWYQKARLGIFIHWGIYSVPAYGNEWYARDMYIQGNKVYEHHRKTYGDQKEFGYKDFIPMFKAEKFNAKEWARLFQEAGAEYVMPVAEHHDGFQMYDSVLSKWNAKNMGPCRDVLGELTEECEKAGLVNCASSHRVEHWFFMGHGKEFDSDIKEPLKRGDLYWPSMAEADHMDINSQPTPTQEFLEDWLCRSCEIVDKYRPKVMYFDWWIQHSSVKPYLKKFAAYYYNRAEEWGEGVVINYKLDAFQFGTAVLDIERGQFAEAKPFIWQTDTAAALNSWGYTENNRYKKSSQLVYDLVDIVSKNGRMLLNIGPKSDGTIPEEDRQILLDIGRWLKVNGEAIYASKVWKIASEGPTKVTEGDFADGEEKVFTKEDFRFTVNGGSIYAICMNMKDCGSVCIKAMAERTGKHAAFFAENIKAVEVLGYDKSPNWEKTSEGLKIETVKIESDMPVVFKITV